MTREEYLEKRKAYYQKNKHKWEEYASSHRDKINAKQRERRANNLESYRTAAKKWRENNKEKVSRYGKKYHSSEKGQARYKKYYEEHKLEFIERAKKSNSKHPDERRAQAKVDYAKKRGELIEQPCEICGATPADAHHDDYNKPLKIRWLCRRCHAEWHSKHEPIRFQRQTGV